MSAYHALVVLNLFFCRCADDPTQHTFLLERAESEPVPEIAVAMLQAVSQVIGPNHQEQEVCCFCVCFMFVSVFFCFDAD